MISNAEWKLKQNSLFWNFRERERENLSVKLQNRYLRINYTKAYEYTHTHAHTQQAVNPAQTGKQRQHSNIA